DLPKDVVRIGSVVTFRSPSVRKENLQLVMPKDADLKANKLSVFTVMGSALIGYREGTKISWMLPKGEEIIHLESVDNSKVAADAGCAAQRACSTWCGQWQWACCLWRLAAPLLLMPMLLRLPAWNRAVNWPMPPSPP